VITALIVDDEPLAREELSGLIAEHRDFTVAAFASGEEALQVLGEKPTDVVFLDIEMPGLTGLEVASHLATWEQPPLVVFATAYHQYAIEAFEANAIDYLLKPYDPERLAKTLDRIRQHLAQGAASSREKLASLEDYLIRKGNLQKLVGHRRNSKDRIVIDPAQVSYFHAELSEVRARLGEEELIVNSTLKELLARLDPARFAQTHKAYIVNLDKVEKVAPMFSGNFQITLKGPSRSTLPLSRRYARSLKERLGHW
jgi:DNA-binding LytR/AlgR family response regulator